MGDTAWAVAASLLWLAASCYWLRPLWRREQSTGEYQTLVVWASQTGQAQRLANQRCTHCKPPATPPPACRWGE